MTLITVLGGSGFIGSHLIEELKQRKLEYYAPKRDEILSGRDLGSIIYCIGLTADFRSKLLETVSAHVCKLIEVIKECRFESLIYLSSTRLYGVNSTPTLEDSPLQIRPSDFSDLYNISKAMGESLTLTATANGTVVRLSNVYGTDRDSGNFLSEIIRAALKEKKILLATSLDSEKDYVDLESVVKLLIEMATKGCQERIYNVASGVNYSNATLSEKISTQTGCKVEVTPNAACLKFPRIDITKIQQEFDFVPGNLLEELPGLVNFYKSLTTES